MFVVRTLRALAAVPLFQFALVTALLVSLVSSSEPERPRYGGPIWLDAPNPPVPSGPVPIREVPLSTERLKQLVEARAGKDVADHLIYRVDKPLPVDTRRHYTIVDQSSANWGGYIADMGSTGNWVSEVRGFFNVRPSAGSPSPFVASWTGIGGISGSQTLVQTGVDQQLMLAWTEFLPNPPQYWFYVSNNDQMFSNVFFDGATGGWVVIIQDYTTGQYHSHEAIFSLNPISAEWISETDVNGYSVPNFGSVPFYFSRFFINQLGFANNIDSPYSARTIRATLRNPYGACIVPGTIGADGVSFNNSWASGC